MRTTPVCGQSFEGRVIGCSLLKQKHRKIFKQARPCLEKMVRNKDYDLKIYTSYGKLRIGIWKHPDYIEPEADTCGTWISGTKQLINSFERDMQKFNEKMVGWVKPDKTLK